LGDVMLGRLIDQLFTVHNESPEDGKHIAYFRKKFQLNNISHSYVWGNILTELQNADLRIINLETSVTTNDVKWPEKAFNYSMHPQNLQCLSIAQIDFCSLANNHVLDFSYAGMYETMSSLDRVNIKWAGAGKNLTEAQNPAIITFHGGIKIACFSYADHYHYWASSAQQAGINFINPSTVPKDFYSSLKNQIDELRRTENIQLVSISIHWGSNYAWEPPVDFNKMAHQLIDICGIDLIHGHSSHHVQGIEIYNKKVIIYGCGDFVDDYAVDEEYRNDLSFLYRLYLDPTTCLWKRLELLPTRINQFQVNRAIGEDKVWLIQTIQKLSLKYKTLIQINHSNDTLFIDI